MLCSRRIRSRQRPAENRNRYRRRARWAACGARTRGRATSRLRKNRTALTFLGYSVLSGFSSTYWWRDHVSGHHTLPNVHGADNDFDFLPVFAVTESDVNTASGWVRKYYTKWQAWVLPPALLLMGVNLQRCGWIDLIACLKN